MLFGLFLGDWTILILIPGLIFTAYAQIKVKTTYARYARMGTRCGATGASAARRILDMNGLSYVPIERIPGELTDHYDPSSKILRLSEAVWHGGSIAAVGVAAHEAGHAVQDARDYFPLRLRIALVPVCNFGARLAMPLFLLGILFSFLTNFGQFFLVAGIGLFSLSVLFQLVTLPVEFNASRRAMRILTDSGSFSQEELRGARRVLTAAALTYVAALFAGLLSLLRLLLIAASYGGRRNR